MCYCDFYRFNAVVSCCLYKVNTRLQVGNIEPDTFSFKVGLCIDRLTNKGDKFDTPDGDIASDINHGRGWVWINLNGLKFIFLKANR